MGRGCRHLSQEYDRPRNGNAYARAAPLFHPLALFLPPSLPLPPTEWSGLGDKIDAALARLSALLAGCGPPITQDCITTVKSHPSPGVSGVKLHRPDGDALPRASDARRCSVMGGRRIGGVEEWRGRRRAGPSGRKRGAAAEGGTAARTCRLNNFALRSKNVALGGGWVGGWEGRESDRFFKRGTWPGLGAKRGGRG